MSDYVTVAELRAYIHDTSSLDAGPAQAAVTSASRKVDAMCGRYFSQDSGVTARYFYPESYWCCPIDDLSTTTGLIVQTDTGYDGTYATTLTLDTNFGVEPRNQMSGGLTGWPYTELTGITQTWSFPLRWLGHRETVKVTGKWGWLAVPDAVKQATIQLAAYYYWLGNVPSTAQTGDFGVVRARFPSTVSELLGPYMGDILTVA